MRRHLEDSTLQIAGSASLFYIIRKVIMNRDTKRKVVTTLLNGMDAHMEEQVVFFKVQIKVPKIPRLSFCLEFICRF